MMSRTFLQEKKKKENNNILYGNTLGMYPPSINPWLYRAFYK